MNNFKVTIGKHKNKNYINVYVNNSRRRFWNGRSIGLDIDSQENPELLKAAFELKLRDGWIPKLKKVSKKKSLETVLDSLEEGIKMKIASRCSERFIKDANRIKKLWIKYENENCIKGLKLEDLNKHHIKSFLIRPNWSAKTQRTVKSSLSAIINCFKPNLISSVKLKKPLSSLHKPITDLNNLLIEIKEYNNNLYICCLLTYGCLLRPHREIRELKWKDFSSDLSQINLSGHRNKSGRNRIVPVPLYIREQLIKGDPDVNIFSNQTESFKEEYFKTLWSRFKKVSTFLEEGQTLYSFRHTGAIDIFKRTGSITKLQKAMGHSSINVSLTYLRGLEVGELKEEDMPVL